MKIIVRELVTKVCMDSIIITVKYYRIKVRGILVGI